MSFLNSLPNELILYISSFLSYEDLYYARLTSSSFYSMFSITQNYMMSKFNKEVEGILKEKFRDEKYTQERKVFSKFIFFACLTSSLKEQFHKKGFLESNKRRRGIDEKVVTFYKNVNSVIGLFNKLYLYISTKLFECYNPSFLKGTKNLNVVDKIDKQFKTFPSFLLHLSTDYSMNIKDILIYDNYCKSLFEFFDSLNFDNDLINSIKENLNKKINITYPLNEVIICKEFSIYSPVNQLEDSLSFKFLPKNGYFTMKDLYLIMKECEKVKNLQGTYLMPKGIIWDEENEKEGGIEIKDVKEILVPNGKLKQWRSWMVKQENFNKNIHLFGKFCEVKPIGDLSVRKFIDLMRIFVNLGYRIVMTKNFRLYGKRVNLTPNKIHTLFDEDEKCFYTHLF